MNVVPHIKVNGISLRRFANHNKIRTAVIKRGKFRERLVNIDEMKFSTGFDKIILLAVLWMKSSASPQIGTITNIDTSHIWKIPLSSNHRL